jgi:hypothetical protein
MPKLKLLQNRYYLPTSHFVIDKKFYNYTLFFCSNRTAQSLSTTMAPSSNSFPQLRWFFSARTHHPSKGF